MMRILRGSAKLWRLVLLLFPAAVALGASCVRHAERSPAKDDVIAEGAVVDVDPVPAVVGAARIDLRWELTGQSGRPHVPCKDVDAGYVLVRLRSAEQPKAPARTFRIACDAGRSPIPSGAGRYLVTAQLVGTSGDVLSTTREQPLAAAENPLSPSMLLFEVRDGFVIRAGK